jgi:FtsP/CotA-like multicopper oxidase with cupredoxin domain
MTCGMSATPFMMHTDIALQLPLAGEYLTTRIVTRQIQGCLRLTKGGSTVSAAKSDAAGAASIGKDTIPANAEGNADVERLSARCDYGTRHKARGLYHCHSLHVLSAHQSPQCMGMSITIDLIPMAGPIILLKR